MPSGSGLLPRTMSGSMVPQQPGSTLVSVACGTTKGYTDAWSLSCNLWLCWRPRTVTTGAMLVWVACATNGAIVRSWPELMLKAMAESTFLIQPGSVMKSTAHVAMGGWVIGTMHVEIGGLH